MAEKRQFIDVWILETNTVYREVPYAVVTDWVQEGRLLENDKLRPSGTAEWHPVVGLPAFAAFLPRAEPFRADDEAEALEPVQTDFAWKRKPDGEEGDVDMIPLIDVSLVLLIFFMMTTTGVAASWFIKTPPAANAWVTRNPELMWVGIDRDRDGAPVYSLGKSDLPPAGPEDKDLRTQTDLLRRLDAHLAGNPDPVEVIIKAHEDLPSGLVRELTLELEKRRDKIVRKYVGVSEGGP